MKNNKIREFLQNTAVKTGAILMASALVLTSGVWSGNLRNETTFVSEAELPTIVDLGEEQEITGEELPLSSAPKVTKKTKTTKKTKNVKLKEKSKKSYTQKGKATTKTTTKKTETATASTTVETKVTTSVTKKFTKGSKVEKDTTTVKTVTTTTVQQKAAAAPATKTATVATTSTKAVAGPLTLSAAAPKVDSRVSKAFTTLGFTASVNPSVNYSGLFDARTRTITLKAGDETIYHELGHFVAFIAGNVDQSAAFQQIFASEQSKYTAYNKAYVVQNSSEYFAESFKNYTLDPGALKASRPQTYAAVEAAVSAITDAQVAKIKTVYRAVWGA